MKIFDMHIHARATKETPQLLLSSMEKAGVFGGCVFTNPPLRATPRGTSFEERLNEALAWERGYEGRIFPVMWIHPYEENIMENLSKAVDAEIAAFKIICYDFYIYEEQPMAVLREIARLGKPVIFHTGILWNGEVSSSYNRPLNFEALLDIPNLKFSLGHCSWPWIDECIALYGKFLNALENGKTAEMFLDITPGTPEIYRRELFEKLFLLGYNVGDNILFGTDCNAFKYSDKWAKRWLEIDRALLDEMGVSLEVREKLYHKNLMRFLGKSDVIVEKEPPVTDDSHAWSAENPEVKVIIEKWYERLSFPKCYDAEFYRALSEYRISDAIDIESYDLECTDGKRNLLSFLFLCEKLEKKYTELGIPESTLLETLSDLVIWCNEYSYIKGGLYLGELSWLVRHMSAKIYRLGRLQFCMADAERDIPEYNIKAGDPVIEIHIPTGERLTKEECEKSIARAKEFFKEYFPAYDYKAFTCHSWLLDEGLSKFLGSESNIIKFGNMFVRVAHDESTALIRYLFPWNTNEANLKYAISESPFSMNVKKAVLRGEKFYEVLGVIEK